MIGSFSLYSLSNISGFLLIISPDFYLKYWILQIRCQSSYTFQPQYN
jgi:hypothetical protein